MAFRIQTRRDTSENWVINNPVLLQAEMGYETDTNKAKFGNGVDPWNDLSYFPTTVSGPTGPPGQSGPTGSAGPTGSSGTSVAVGVYSIKLEFDGGSLISSPFIQAKDPDGNPIVSGYGGWTFVRNNGTSITIIHPIGKLLINFNRLAQNSSGEYVTANVSGSSTSNFSAIQNSARTQFTINSLSIGSGLSLTGTSFLYLTWQAPSYNFS